jgi:gluconokinase
LTVYKNQSNEVSKQTFKVWRIKMNFLALEISTASAKALVYSVEHGVKKVKCIPFDPVVCDIASQEPEGVFTLLGDCIKAILKDETEPIAALGICTTWHSLLFLDGQRKPIGRIYTWANFKASHSVKRYREDSQLCDWYYKRTGCMVNSTYPFWQYIHYRDTDAAFCRKARFLSSQEEYIFEILTGEAAVSRCTASGSGFLNIHTLDWDEEVIEFAGVRREQLAPLKEPTFAAPLQAAAAKELGLPPGIPVIIGGADGALNQIGADAVQEGIMTLSVGTSGAIRLVSNKVILPPHPATWCYYLAEGKYIVGGGTSGAGNCVEWFANKMGLRQKIGYAELDQMVKMVDIENAPFFLPFLYGERCPGWVDSRLGGFFNLSSEHGMGDLYYAVLEGVLFNLYHCYLLLTEMLTPPQMILVSGGIARSDFWVRMVADIFQRDIQISNITHVSLLGVVKLIYKALGITPNLGRDQLNDEVVVCPDKTMQNNYGHRFEEYLAVYNSIK